MRQRLEDLVEPGKGRVSRVIFQDQEVYDLELERIFARCWLYLGHTTQLKEPGDYFITYMGEDSVIVTRDKDGQLHAFLNSCRHRGMRVCRSEAGNASFFRCSYHGWTYRNDGALIGIPRYETGYFKELDMGHWGLVEVPKLVDYRGMIWGNWDVRAPPLEEYLGGMRYYLDLLTDRVEGGLEVIGGVHKWKIPSNWKFAADNFVGDMYHVPTSHRSVVEVGLRKPWTDNGYEINPGNGHGFGGEVGGLGAGAEIHPEVARLLDKARERLVAEKGKGIEKFMPIGHMTIFPNFSALDTPRYRGFFVWQPKGPNSMVAYSWCLVDRAVPEEVKMQTRKNFMLREGPGGIVEQDDMENWSQCTASTRGWIGRNQDFNYQMGLGHERTVGEATGLEGAPGTAGAMWSEINQRGFYKRWLDLMISESWEELSRRSKASPQGAGPQARRPRVGTTP